MCVEVAFLCKAFATVGMRAGENVWGAPESGVRVNGVDVYGQVIPPSKAFATACLWTRKGGRGGGVNSLQVSGQVIFLCEAFTAACVRAGECRGGGERI